MQNNAGGATKTLDERAVKQDLRQLASAKEAEAGMNFSLLIGKPPKKRKRVVHPETEMLQILQRLSR